MTHDEAIKLAERWYRQRYEVSGSVEVRSTKEDRAPEHWYCEMYSTDVADPIGILVYADGDIVPLGEGMELIKITTIPDRAILIRSISGATPVLEGFPAILRDGDTYVTINRVEDIFTLARACKHDIAIRSDDPPYFLVIDDYYD